MAVLLAFMVLPIAVAACARSFGAEKHVNTLNFPASATGKSAVTRVVLPLCEVRSLPTSV